MKFDSKEEEYFSWYLDELYEADYIESYLPQPPGYSLSKKQVYFFEKQLKTKVKSTEKTFLREHIYTPDFFIAWSHKARNIFYNELRGVSFNDLGATAFIANTGRELSFSTVEIKPAFDRNNMTRLFIINQKWVYAEHSHYVQRITVDKKNGKGLFAETFTPEKYLLTDKSKKPRKLHYEPRTLSEYVSETKTRG